MTPCEACPAAPGSLCLAVRDNNPHVCRRVAEGHEGFIRLARDQVAAEAAGRRPAPTPTATPVATPAPPPPAPDDERARLAVLVDTCPDRLTCQCKEPIACRIKGPGTLARCLECRRAASPA